MKVRCLFFCLMFMLAQLIPALAVQFNAAAEQPQHNGQQCDVQAPVLSFIVFGEDIDLEEEEESLQAQRLPAFVTAYLLFGFHRVNPNEDQRYHIKDAFKHQLQPNDLLLVTERFRI